MEKEKLDKKLEVLQQTSGGKPPVVPSSKSKKKKKSKNARRNGFKDPGYFSTCM